MARQQESYARHEATEEEVKELRHVVDSVPFIVWVALVANATERFTFYAVTTPWRAYQKELESTTVVYCELIC